MIPAATEPQSLTFKDGLELSLHAGANVDKHWSQFYVVLFGLFAWLSSNISMLGRKEALIITIATFAFFVLNAIATVRAYSILNLIIDETVQLARKTHFASDYVNKTIKIKRLRVILPLRVPIAILGHLAGAA